jgi:anthranilate 1,2-dioxygenase ferredoxin component
MAPALTMTQQTFLPAAELGEFAAANPLRKLVNGWSLLIFRDGEQVYAFFNLCTHLGVRMNAPRAAEGAIICPYHGARFDLHTGRCLDSTSVGVCLAPLTRFETRLIGNRIEVALPSRGAAAQRTINVT